MMRRSFRYPFRQLRPVKVLRNTVAIAVSTVAIAIGTVNHPVFAADPFRTSEAHVIDDGTEAAFRAIFEQGNYVAAREAIEQSSADEPLAHAIKASLAFLDEDWETFSQNATLTRETAERLIESDPLRGHLYTAVGHFLEGAYAISTQGTVRGAPVALSKLQQVFNSIEEAEQIDPNDPELNLLRGYMDLMLAVNLPFSNPNQAIARLENYAAPDYVAQRGIAIGYRDLDQPDKAMTAVDQAIQLAPENPELYYLKAQILVKQDRHQESLQYFEQALTKEAQLPQSLANQIAWEGCRAQIEVDNEDRDCHAFLERGE